jgi:hypothetical protein
MSWFTMLCESIPLASPVKLIPERLPLMLISVSFSVGQGV